MPDADAVKDEPSLKRATISLPPKIWDWAQAMMASEGYENFSAFVAQLVRERYKQEDTQHFIQGMQASPAPAPGAKRRTEKAE